MKDILGFEGIYSVTKEGKVWSCPRIIERANGFPLPIKGRWLKPATDHKGYHYVLLSKKDADFIKKVHRIVAEAYISNPLNLPQVNHKNTVKTDNRMENLEWMTNEENMAHAVKKGLLAKKLSFEQVEEIRQLYDDGETQYEIATKYFITQSMVSYIISGHSWKRR